MRRPSVLLVSYHFLPAATPGSRRLDTMARMLAERGWESIILTGTGSDGEDGAIPGVEVIRTARRAPRADGGGPAIARPALSRLPVIGGVVSFPDRYAPWAVPLVPRLLGLLRARPIDVVVSSSPPHSTQVALAAARALRPFRWVAEFRDPWMFPSRRSMNAASAALQRRMERRVLRLADRVVANTPGNRAALLAANPGLDAARVRVSTNGYDAAFFARATPAGVPGETADLTYVGEVYAGMLERYAAAIATIRARNAARVPRLVVYGTIHALERRRMADLGLEAYLDDRGFVSHEDSVAAMRRARALLVLLPEHERWRTCVPSKVYWYLAARRPIVAVVPDGDTAALVRSMKAGLVLGEGGAERVGRELESFVVQARAAPAPALAGEGVERYAMTSIVDDFDRMLREVTDGSRA
jgi:hypothetical protein